MRRLSQKRSGLAAREYAALARLTTPVKIQDFLDALPMNWEKRGDTHYSPRLVLREKKAHCIEGALLAAVALWIHGEPPLIMDFSVLPGDDGHVIALYRRGGRYGAVSKTNHATIRFRDPVYRTPRELALSYFHEWFMNTDGRKTLHGYARPFDLSRLDPSWITAEEPLWFFDELLDAAPHYALAPKGSRRFIRRADPMELAAGRLVEWPKSDPRT